MNTKELECFVEVAESLNFTAASASLFLSQPTVTRQIRLLEEELGVQLFVRTRKTVSLTPAGESFYTDAKEILSRMLIAKSRASHNNAGYSGKISVGYSGTALEETLIPRVLAAFSRRYPQVYVFLKQLNYKDLVSQLKSKKMDVIFTYSKDSIHQDDSLFYSLICSGYYILMPQDHPLAALSQLSADDLKKATVILPEASSCPKEVRPLISYLVSQLPASQIHYCDTPKTAFLLAKSGMGVTIMPEFDIPVCPSIAVKRLDTRYTLQYGAACLKHQTGQKYIDAIIQLSLDEAAPRD